MTRPTLPVTLLLTAWDDLDRAVADVSDADMLRQIDGGSCFAWTLAHLTYGVDSWICKRFQQLPPNPILSNPRFNYGGDGAYVVMYVTDRAGRYQGTLWMAGDKAKYYKHLRDWSRLSGGRAKLDGITGASVGAGRMLRATLDVADTLIDAGYEIHIDTAVEKMNENPSEVVVPLTTSGAAKPVKGRGYVKSFRYLL